MMRFFVPLILLAVMPVAIANSQTLNEALIQEDSAKLVDAARQKGDVVRGAILFHQGNINCVKCHRPKSESDRIGPNLSLIDQQTTDVMLVDSVLQPSKDIRKGYETVKVLTLDGQFIEGMVVTDAPDRLILRDNADADRLITINRIEIEEIRPGTKSSMPDGLVDQLKNRQQFLDLMRYVFEIRDRGPTVEVAMTNQTSRRQLSPELEGLLLINDRNCFACHQRGEVDATVKPKQAPDLRWSGKWLNPKYMTRYIASPTNVKPGTSMPHLLDQLDEPTRSQTALAITHFLTSTASNDFQNQPIDAAAVGRGETLFHSIGCVACHSPRDASAVETDLGESIALGDLSGKYNVAGLVNFLEAPRTVRHSGRMPEMQLTRWEAQDIANYLLQSSAQEPETWKVDESLAQAGAKLFSEHKCNSCHTQIAGGRPQTEQLSELATLAAGQGCLSGEAGQWPNFRFDDQEREFIRTALAEPPVELTDQDQIEFTLKSFNCIACHDRADFGGVTSIRNPHFQTTNLNLGEQGRIPPTLTGVGAKLKPQWMRDVLVNARAIRPYMKTRMPQYGEENVGQLVELFQRSDRLPPTEFAKFEDQKEMRKYGLELAGNQGLNCVACHTYKYKLSDTMPAVDLTEMAERLHKDWFYQYMLNPQKFSPNTVMPSFWPSGVAIRKDLTGDPDYQIEALWQYLIDGRQAGTPRGVVREPLEIVVAKEAQMLRRKYPGIGKRGIGVGYPGGLNLAYDAEQMRLAMIWTGKFVDPAGVWTGQGHGNVRPMGAPVNFATGPELDDRDTSWMVDDGRPPEHHFKGYQLDELRRPTFFYQFEQVSVSDYFTAVGESGSSKNLLNRTITLKSDEGRPNLRFRIASSNEISQLENGVFAIGKGLKAQVASRHNAKIFDVDGIQQLEVLLDVAPSSEEQLVIRYWILP